MGSIQLGDACILKIAASLGERVLGEGKNSTDMILGRGSIPDEARVARESV